MLDNGPSAKVDDSTYGFIDLANGKHAVTVQAFDNAGNVSLVMVKFTVKV
jgi:hypothetical protein